MSNCSGMSDMNIKERLEADNDSTPRIGSSRV